MDLRGCWKIRLRTVVFTYVFIARVICPVHSMTVKAPVEINAAKGDAVTLSCTFTSTSRTTSRMSVDWSFRPKTGGPAQMFFHFYLQAFPPSDGPFKGRIKWLGSPSKGDASLQLLNATLNDNGTYVCAVKNPPDAHGRPAQTVLTVTPKKLSVRFTDVAVLFLFVLLPSTGTALLLLARMLCPCCGPRPSYHSPIEVLDGEEYVYKQPAPKERSGACCELYCMDLEDEEYYLSEKYQLDEVEETQC